MSDLDKLVNKLKKKEAPKKQLTPEEEEDLEEEDEDEDDDDDDDDEVPEKIEVPKKSVKQEEESVNAIEQEVMLLQNDGIFRRELIYTLKDLVSVITDVRNRLVGDDDKGE